MSLFASWLKAGGKTFFLLLPFSCTVRKWTNWIFLHDDESREICMACTQFSGLCCEFFARSINVTLMVVLGDKTPVSAGVLLYGLRSPVQNFNGDLFNNCRDVSAGTKATGWWERTFSSQRRIAGMTLKKKKNTACLCRKPRNTKVYHCGVVNCTEKTDKRQTLIWAAFNLSCDWCEFIGGGV